MRTLRLTALTLAVTALSTLSITGPASASSRPIARPDTTTLTAGSSGTVNVLANDSAAHKSLARVRVTSKPEAWTTRITVSRKIRLSVPAATPTGTYALRYRLTDTQRRSATTTVKVIVRAPAGGTTTTTGTPTLRDLVTALPIATEHREGYDRTLFKHWIDADSDGCDTRREVLLAEATTAPTVGASCSFTGGAWFSYYDNTTTTDSSTFDIDHVVPLAEAWDSGAYAWTPDTRMRYANDLDEPRALVAVSASTNRSKGDQDFAEWTPPAAGTTCRYLTDWVVVKTRWSLTVDTTEKSALQNAAAACPNPTLSVTKATVTTG